MTEKIGNKDYCFDTLPFLRDIILFATSPDILTPTQIIEKARQNQENTQETVDCLFLSKSITNTRVIQCSDYNSTHAIAINENGEVLDVTFGLNSFLKSGENTHIGDSRFEYSNFFFKIFKYGENEPRKIFSNLSSSLSNLKDYQLTAENFIRSNFLGSLWKIEEGKMLGFIDIKGFDLKISFSDKKYKFNILEIQDYEDIENILDDFFVAINGCQYSKNTLAQIKSNISIIISNFSSLKKVRSDLF